MSTPLNFHLEQYDGPLDLLLDLIRKLVKEVNASLMLVSHDPVISKQLGRVLTLSELNRASR